MPSINKVTLIGRVGKEPEVHALGSGESVANFSLATSTKWKDRNSGEMKEQTEWHSIVFYKKTAQVIEQYVHKGSLLFVEGQLRNRKFTDKTGVEKTVTEIVGASLVLLDKKEFAQRTSDEDDIPF
jgi:single-strand DNA-binding protein